MHRAPGLAGAFHPRLGGPGRIKEGLVDPDDVSGVITHRRHQTGQGKALPAVPVPQAGMGAQAFRCAPERLPADPARRK